MAAKSLLSVVNLAALALSVSVAATVSAAASDDTRSASESALVAPQADRAAKKPPTATSTTTPTPTTTTAPPTTLPPPTTTVASSTTAGPTVPDSTTPEPTLPDSTVPDPTTPETTAPDTTAANTTLPDTTTPDTVADTTTTSDPTGGPSTTEHAPLHEGAGADAPANREPGGGQESSGPSTTSSADQEAAERAARDGITIEEARRRIEIDRTRKPHPVPEVDRWYWQVVESGIGDPALWMYRICRESRGDPEAWNRGDPSGGSVGLLQLNLGNRAFLGRVGVLSSPSLNRHEAAMELMDPLTNLRAARALVEAAGERGWITRHRRPDCDPPPGVSW